MIRFFKKKEKEKPVEVKKEEPVEVKPQSIKETKKERKAVVGETYRVLKTPHITEKATDLTEKNQYVFKVYPETNKTEIKKAIQSLYGVDVISVKIINIPRRQRRLGRVLGWRKGYKKAIVRVKEGQKIEVLPR